MVFVERLEWGPFIGTIKSVTVDGVEHPRAEISDGELGRLHEDARDRWRRIRVIERSEIGNVNFELERERLRLRRIALAEGKESQAYRTAEANLQKRDQVLQAEYRSLAAEAAAIRAEDGKVSITLRRDRRSGEGAAAFGRGAHVSGQ